MLGLPVSGYALMSQAYKMASKILFIIWPNHDNAWSGPE